MFFLARLRFTINGTTYELNGEDLCVYDYYTGRKLGTIETTGTIIKYTGNKVVPTCGFYWGSILYKGQEGWIQVGSDVTKESYARFQRTINV